MFIVSIQNSFTLLFASWTSDRKTIDIQLEYQVDTGSARNIFNPKSLIVIDQTFDTIGVPEKTNNRAIFDNLKIRKYHVDIDGVRYPWDGVSIDYAINDYADRYRDLKNIL